MKEIEIGEDFVLFMREDFEPVTLPGRNKWIEALESGKYVKGHGKLIDHIKECGELKTEYCCLGVKMEVDGFPVDDNGHFIHAPGNKEIPMINFYNGSCVNYDKLRRYGSLYGCFVRNRNHMEHIESLAILNDRTETFAQVIEVIKHVFREPDPEPVRIA